MGALDDNEQWNRAMSLERLERTCIDRVHLLMQTVQTDENLSDDAFARTEWEASGRNDLFEHIEIPS
jgi:hypothetical protein